MVTVMESCCFFSLKTQGIQVQDASCVTFSVLPAAGCHWIEGGAAEMDQNNSIPAFQGLASPQVSFLNMIF